MVVIRKCASPCRWDRSTKLRRFDHGLVALRRLCADARQVPLWLTLLLAEHGPGGTDTWPNGRGMRHV